MCLLGIGDYLLKVVKKEIAVMAISFLGYWIDVL